MSDSSPPPGPLAGVRVVDLTNVVMGPLATRMLGDMGADVIRVEEPGGDVIRAYPPMRNPAMSAFSISLNRNKRSIVLDLKTDDGSRALFELIATADVFVTNMRRSALERLGLDEDGVRAAKDDIIYCISNGYGSDGPYADRAAYDDIMQAASGLASTFKWLGDDPKLVPSIYADKVTGVHIAFAIAAALHGRATTGKGTFIEVPMAETMAAFNLIEHLGGSTFEPAFGGFSYSRIKTANRRPRQTTDGWIVLLPYSRANWETFWDYGGRSELEDDERFGTAANRVRFADDLYQIMGEIIADRSTEEWLSFCAENSIPVSEVLDLEFLGDDEHFAAVELIQDGVHPTEGAYHWVRDPIMFDGEHSRLRQPAPRLGADTAEVLAELGWTTDEIEPLTANE
ncbi:MAG: CoA transferase [Actinomycetia bacterium]|nr:CoA transferase [Actinomycetes bacterium]MCP4961283.1 CoA transferase [Actinomycetes bacterium]